MKEKQKDYDFIVVIAVICVIVFIFLSLLLITFTSTEWKDMYTTFFSIFGSVVGGLLGGYITLLGVQRTIEGQREQESLKLIPQKIIGLHKLIKKIDNLESKFMSSTFRIRSICNKDYSIEEIKKIIDDGFGSLITFGAEIKNIEYEFIEIVSQIDIETYKDIKQFFDQLEGHFDKVAYSDTIDNLLSYIVESEGYIKKIDNDFYLLLDILLDDLAGLTKSVFKNFSKIREKVPLKLEQYQKEIL